jgi:hypothetical protein
VSSYRKLQKTVRDAQKRADRDGAEFCIVQMGDVLYVRTPARARNMVRKHSDAKIVARVKPADVAA